MRRSIALSLLFTVTLFGLYAQEIKPLPDTSFFKVRTGLRNTLYRLTQYEDPITIAYLGGSITHMSGWRDKVDSFFRASFPKNKFRFINAGIPSLGSLPHSFRLQRDVLDSGRIDLLFLEAAVNDHVNGTDSLTQVRTLEGIIRHARKANPYMDIIMMSFADPDKTKDYDEGRVPTEIANHELIAGHYHLPSINLAREVHDRIRNSEFSWDKDFKDLHPSPFGQALYFKGIASLVQACRVQGEFKGVVRLAPYPHPAPLNNKSFDRGKYVSNALPHTDSAWALNPDWMPTDGLHTRKGFVHVPMLVASTPGATLSFHFKGTAVGIAIVSGKDAGMIEYSIDKGPYKKMDLFTQWSKSLHLPWYLLFDGALKKKKHTVRIRILEDKNPNSSGHACRIVHFLVNE